MRERPAGVIVLGVLAIVWGVFGLCVSGLLLLYDHPLARRFAPRIEAPPASLAGVILALSIVLLIQALLYIIFGIGALQYSPWAWTLGIVLALVGLVVRTGGLLLDHRPVAIGGNVVGVAVDLIVLFYLFSANVRQAFGEMV